MSDSELVLVIDWLLGHAVGLEYRDNTEEYNLEAERIKNAPVAAMEQEPTEDTTTCKIILVMLLTIL
jgi:hypothetical protein